MKQLCLAISLLAYSGYANAVSIQLAAIDAKSESDSKYPPQNSKNQKNQTIYRNSKLSLLRIRLTQPKMLIP
jgi:hypothetical protein